MEIFETHNKFKAGSLYKLNSSRAFFIKKENTIDLIKKNILKNGMSTKGFQSVLVDKDEIILYLGSQKLTKEKTLLTFYVKNKICFHVPNSLMSEETLKLYFGSFQEL